MKRAVFVLVSIVVLILVLGAVGIWGTLRASLPTLDGEEALPGLSSAVTVERDAAGGAGAGGRGG